MALGCLLVSQLFMFCYRLKLAGKASDLETGDSTNYTDCDQGGQVRDTPVRSDFDPAGATASSVLEPFSMSEVDRASVDNESVGQRDSLFSSPEPEGSAVDSNTSVESVVDKRGEVPTLEHLDCYDWAGQGKDQGKEATPIPPELATYHANI
jgi:hypothetical protein